MVSKGFPNVTTSGRQYNFGEKPSVILYTYINLHAGTPKPQSFLSKSPGLQCSIGSERELYKYINHYSVVTKASICRIANLHASTDTSPQVLLSFFVVFNGAPRVWAEKKKIGHKILMKQPHDCSY